MYLHETCSHRVRPPGKHKRLSSVRLSLPKACSGIPPPTEGKYPVSGLHVAFAENKQTAQLYGLLRGKRLQGMMEGRISYVDGTVFSVVPASTDKCLGFVERADLIRKNVLYTGTVKEALFSQRDDGWVKREMRRLQSGTWESKSAVENTSAPYFSSDLLTLKLHFLERLVDDPMKFRSLYFMDARPFEHFNRLVERSKG